MSKIIETALFVVLTLLVSLIFFDLMNFYFNEFIKNVIVYNSRNNQIELENLIKTSYFLCSNYKYCKINLKILNPFYNNYLFIKNNCINLEKDFTFIPSCYKDINLTIIATGDYKYKNTLILTFLKNSTGFYLVVK